MTPHLMAKYSWANTAQLECIALFCDLVGGQHNLNGNFLNLGGNGVCINQKRSFATYDDNWLTKLVFMAHDRCIRVELQAAGHGNMRVILFKRAGRDGRMLERHPTLEHAIESFRNPSIHTIQNQGI